MPAHTRTFRTDQQNTLPCVATRLVSAPSPGFLFSPDYWTWHWDIHCKQYHFLWIWRISIKMGKETKPLFSTGAVSSPETSLGSLCVLPHINYLWVLWGDYNLSTIVAMFFFYWTGNPRPKEMSKMWEEAGLLAGKLDHSLDPVPRGRFRRTPGCWYYPEHVWPGSLCVWG